MSCPSDLDLLAHLEGQLDDAGYQLTQRHLDACTACLELVATLARGSRTGGGDPDGPDYRELVTVSPEYYAVGRELARGGMGRVMEARDRRLGRPVAIKELLTSTPELRARFEREARITARLQHPAIVNLLEAGTWPDGEPFYVMKLVTADSLDNAISRRPTLDARLGLLPHVIAAVDAIAYAHSVRLIHRDLKPANVLVGEFGETVVIDWGLAKDLAAPGGAADVAGDPLFRAPPMFGETRAGSVIGTAAYMPVEQAEGDAVDERADVYALGAMLYHVLAGAPPYTGTSSDAVLAAVISGPPEPIEERAVGVPPDLVTIVNKAMARATAERYVTAQGLADDLKKFQTGQLVGAHHYSAWQLLRRWIRRHRTPVAVAAVAVVLLGGLGLLSLRRIVREQARSEHQRQVAERSRGDAEDLMIYMLGDLRDKLQPLGKLPLLDEVANKAITYYERGGEDVSDDVRWKRARARTNLGSVLLSQGHADAALGQYQAAQTIVVTLAAKDPTNLDWQRALATSDNGVGEVLLAQGDAAGALAQYRAALAIAEAVAATDPANADWQRDVSVCDDKVGDVLLAEGDSPGALAAFRASQTIAETLAARDPTRARWQRDVSVSHNKIGDVLLVQGDASGALAAYRAARTIREVLAARDPTNADWQRDLSVSHNKIGDVLLDRGDPAGALAAYRAARSIRERLAASDATNADWQRDVSVSDDRIGDLLFTRGDLVAALPAYQESLAIAQALAANNPTNAEWQRDVSVSYDKVGEVLFAQGDSARARSAFRASLAIREVLATKDPTNTDRQRDLSVSHNKVGDLLLAQGDAAGALAAYRDAQAIADRLAANDPTNVDWQQGVSVSDDNVGDALLAQGDAAAALAAYRTSQAIATSLAASDPSNTVRQRDLAVSHEKVGDALAAQHELAGALAAYQAGVAVVRRLQAKQPGNADLDTVMSTLTTKIGRCCGAMVPNHPR